MPSSNATNAAAAGAASSVIVGIDLGTYHARLAIWDDALLHPVLVHNHDGQRTTRVELPDAGTGNDTENSSSSPTIIQVIENVLLPLASDATRTPINKLQVVYSIPNTIKSKEQQGQGQEEFPEWYEILKKMPNTMGIITEAAATCLAYPSLWPSQKDLNPTTETATSRRRTVLLVDGGASGVKTSLVHLLPSNLEYSTSSNNNNSNNNNNDTTNGSSIVPAQSAPLLVNPSEYNLCLSTVSGPALLEAMAKSIAQQFEIKHRLPKGEVWMNSKKARNKLIRACTTGFATLYRNSNVTIHVDGLYEGMDCQVTLSKPKWDHVSSTLGRQVKQFLKQHYIDANTNKHKNNDKNNDFVIDQVVVGGMMQEWLTPLCQSVFGRAKVVKITDSESAAAASASSSTSISSGVIDPAEAIAYGCCQQAKFLLSLQQKQDQQESSPLSSFDTPTNKSLASPISIGIKFTPDGSASTANAASEEKEADTSDKTQKEDMIVLIHKGTPLPVMVSHIICSDANDADTDAKKEVTIYQIDPTLKALCRVDLSDDNGDDDDDDEEEKDDDDIDNDDDEDDDDDDGTTTLQLQLSSKGQLRVWLSPKEEESLLVIS